MRHQLIFRQNLLEGTNKLLQLFSFLKSLSNGSGEEQIVISAWTSSRNQILDTNNGLIQVGGASILKIYGNGWTSSNSQTLCNYLGIDQNGATRTDSSQNFATIVLLSDQIHGISIISDNGGRPNTSLKASRITIKMISYLQQQSRHHS